MEDTKVTCPKCGQQAVLIDREVIFGEEIIEFFGPISVPIAEIQTIECPNCGRYKRSE